MKSMYTLEELARELQRQADVKADYLADTRNITMLTSRTHEGPIPVSELEISGADSGPLVVNDVAHEQVATRLGIPKRYYDRLRVEIPGLLDENVNRWFRHQPAQRMVRTLDQTARAFLSDAYRRLDNDEIASAVLPILGEIPDLQVRSCAVTDTRMYIKATTPRIRGEVVGQEVCAGVYVGNSEVGYGSVVVYPFVETLICTNGMVVQQAGEGMMRQVHVGRRVEAGEGGRIFRDETVAADDRAFMMALGDVVRAAVDEVRFRELVAQMNAAADAAPVKDVVASTRLLMAREGLTEAEGHNVLQHLAEGGDLSKWGVVSAITRAAQDVESYDRSTELEAMGGKVLAYADRDWRQVAAAELAIA